MFEPGNVVTVCWPDTVCDGKQAQVIRIDPVTNEVLVKLGPKDEYLLGGCSDAEKEIRFQESQLRKDEDWSPENMAIILFGQNHFHSLYVLKEKFVPEEECSHKECHEPNTQRIMVNVWGCVAQHDVCAKHAKQYHGKMIDNFPSK